MLEDPLPLADLQSNELTEVQWKEIIDYKDQPMELFPHAIAIGVGILIFWCLLIW